MWYIALNIVKIYLGINTSLCLIKMGVDMFLNSLHMLIV